MRGALKYLVAAAIVALLPATALAQGSFTGVVRDSSGAVLPGVTVEASSDALIEKSKSAVTDESGQYRIVDLRSGTYRLTFTLTGFTTVVRDAVELSGNTTLTIPADMTVGNLAEQVVVTADTPVVDVQSVARETVLQSDFVQSLPATRHYSAILQMIPAINVGFAVSAETTPEMQLFNARGGEGNEGRVTVNGLIVAAPFGGGGVSSVIYNTTDVTEIQVQISGGLGEVETGGPTMNIIPRAGGNAFRGSAFLSTAGEWSRSDNIDDYLRSVGITRGPALRQQLDTNGSYGGPIKRDRLWFYGTVRQVESGRIEESSIGGNLNAGNRNAADPNSWLFRRDTSVEEVRNVQKRNIYSGRLTGQFAKHRWSFSQENQYRCDGSTLMTDTEDGCRQRGTNWIALGGTTTSPEADAGYFPQPYYTTQATWTMPKTNRLLLEAGFSRLAYVPVFGQPAPDAIFDIIPVEEQFASTPGTTDLRFAPRNGTDYRALSDYSKGWARNNAANASATYVTGSHNMKLGYQGRFQLSDSVSYQNTNPGHFEYRLARGVPNRFTVNLPDWETADRTFQHSIFAQDSWTYKRLTIQGAIRFDHAYSWAPAEGNGTDKTSPWNSGPIRFDRTVGVRGYDDITTRWGVAYDLFGTGKTALKFNYGKYLDSATSDENYTRNNPANRIRRNMDRSWTDNDGDKIVDCDIMNFAAQGPTAAGSLRTVDACGAIGGDNALFGRTIPDSTIVNPAVLGGWGVRPYDWQFGVAVQQELVPRVSIEVAYNRRWWGNYTVTDNVNVSPEMYDRYTVVAPVDPRLPGGGGYEVERWTIKPEFGGRPAQNYVTFETDYGPARTHYWHGVEVTGSARTRWGLMFQGGTSIGRTVMDRCDTLTKLDQPGPVFPGGFGGIVDCRIDAPARPNFRGSASYTVPKVDVLVSTIMRFTPSPGLGASYTFPNSYIQERLGRLPFGQQLTGNTNVALLNNERRLYADKHHRQVDMRFAKIFRFGGRRADVGIDLYNIFNVNTPTGYDGGYDAPPAANGGQWLQPTSIVQPRFARFNVTVSF